MNPENLLYLQKQIIITKNTIKKIIQTNDHYAHLVLQRLHKKKIIKRVTAGVYTTKDNIYEISTHIETPSYISLSSAAMLKGHTEQIINTVHIMTTKNKEFLFEKYRIQFIRTQHFFGYEKTQNPEIFIANDEKLLIDMLLYQKEVGNFDEIIKTATNGTFSKEKILSYLAKIDNKSLTKRIGFLLEKICNIDISKEIQQDNNYVYLNTVTKKSTHTNTKWRIKHDIN